MKINRNNYEIFFLDYLEGKLNATEVAELLLFVDNHPDLQQELEMMRGEVPVIPGSDEVGFGGKLSLKKSEAGEMSRIDELFAKKLEGDLTDEEAAELTLELENNPTLFKEWELFSLSKLRVEDELSFSDKASLRQHEPSELDLRMAAAVEGSLSEKEHSELQSVLQKENRERELALMTVSKLTPDTSVRFFNKNSLKKKVPVVGMFWRSAAAVAAVALFAFLLSPVLFKSDVETGSFADRNGVSPIERDASSEMVNESQEDKNTFESKTLENVHDDVKPQQDHIHYANISENEEEDKSRGESKANEKVNRIKLQKMNRQKLNLSDAAIAVADIARPAESPQKVESKGADSSPKADQFMTLASLATQKAEQVSGVNFNSDNLKGELVQKAVNLINNQSNEVVKIDVAEEQEGDGSRGWMFKIGKVEVSRKKAM
ncbi:hypothetical protein [Halocola ammonii]